LRMAVREVLAPRFPTALGVAAIRRRVEQDQMLDFKVTDEGVVAALAFLEGAGQVARMPAELGAVDAWKATTAGVRAWERGER
jgi:hypothetical protein